MGNILSGLIGGALVIFFTAFFGNRKQRNLLIEKWMNNLRDEISFYLGKCEQLRMLGISGEKYDSSNPIYGELICSMYKIEMLLNTKSSDQIKLTKSVKKLRDLADSRDFQNFEMSENEIVKTTVSILDNHWNDISFEMKYTLPNKFNELKNKIIK